MERQVAKSIEAEIMCGKSWENKLEMFMILSGICEILTGGEMNKGTVIGSCYGEF